MSGLKILHVITTLQTGGAEIMLERLLSRSAAVGHEPFVINLTEPGEIAERIAATGVPIETLESRRGLPNPALVWRIARTMRQFQPDVVQTWMYHSDLVGGLAARFAGRPPVAWGLHHSNLSPAFTKRSTLLTARACARLSHRVPAAVVCCAESTRSLHEAFGYDRQKMTVIPNGFDLDAFRPDPAARASLRQELGLAPDTVLTGILARFHPQKDHETFLRAAGLVARHRPDARFVLCGDGCTPENEDLNRWIGEAGLGGRVHLLGRRADVARIQASLDVACLSSMGGEAMPLTIGEAMACGVPCAVTGVGDAALLVGDTGRVAPPGDPEALAAAIAGLLSLDPERRAALGLAARRRIGERYGLDRVARLYADLHERLAATTLPLAA